MTNADAAAAFRGTGVADPSEGPPDAALTDLYVAVLDPPSIGRNLLGPSRYDALMRELGPGNHAVMVVSAGPEDAPENPVGDRFVLGAVPDRLAIGQGGLIVNARDMAVERREAGLAEGLPPGPWTVLRIDQAAGFDPSAPWALTETIVRERGQILSEKIARTFTVETALPADLFTRSRPDDGPSWTDPWRARAPELALIGLMLAVLVPVLSRQRGLVADGRRFALFRLGFLALTLGFVGWFAQAQLSIVTLVGLVRAATATHDLAFLLYDPPSLVLWAFALAALVAWGRGTFCGWLCPFGALQELVALLARPLRIRPVAVPPGLDRALRSLKYVVLAGILGAAAAGSPSPTRSQRSSRSRPPSPCTSSGRGRSSPTRRGCWCSTSSSTRASAATCARSAPPSPSSGGSASSTGSRAGRSAARPASSARSAAATAPSRPPAGSTTPSASSAWSA